MGTASLLLLCVVGRKDESVYVKALCRLCDEITYGEVDDKMEKKNQRKSYPFCNSWLFLFLNLTGFSLRGDHFGTLT